MNRYPLTKQTHCKKCGSIGPFILIAPMRNSALYRCPKCGLTWTKRNGKE